MPVAHESIVFDVHDFKVYPLLTDPLGAAATFGPAVDVPGIAEVSMSPNFVTAELKGDARIMARKGRVDKITGSATYGKLSLDVLKVLLGGVTTDATTVSSIWALTGTNSLPYFKTAFSIQDLDTGLGDMHSTMYKCQVTGGTLVGGSSDEFTQPTLEWEAIPLIGQGGAPAVSGAMLDVGFYAAFTALPA